MWYKEFCFCMCSWCVKNYKSVCGVWWNFIYLDLFVWVVFYLNVVMVVLYCKISCCDLCCVCVYFFCSLWRRWTYKYMLSKIYLAVARMKFLVGGLVLYRYDFLSKSLCGCACVWWCFYSDGFLCYKFAKKISKNIKIIYYLIIYNNL